MKAIVIGAAKPGYAEAITRRLIKEGIFVIGTFDEEYSINANKLQKEYSNDRLILKKIDLSSRKELNEFVNSINGVIDGIVFAQFFFKMENPDKFDHEIWDKSIAINLTAPNYLIHELKNKMEVQILLLQVLKVLGDLMGLQLMLQQRPQFITLQKR